jgi:hypothetical protein
MCADHVNTLLLSLLCCLLQVSASAAAAADTSKSLDLKLLAMQELMARERKAAEAAYTQKRAAGAFMPPDLSAADEAALPELLLQHYKTARPIAEPFTVTVCCCAAALPPAGCNSLPSAQYGFLWPHLQMCSCWVMSLTAVVNSMRLMCLSRIVTVCSACLHWLQVAGVRKPLSAALDGLPAAAVCLGLLAKQQQQQLAGGSDEGPTDEALGGSYLPGVCLVWVALQQHCMPDALAALHHLIAAVHHGNLDHIISHWHHAVPFAMFCSA